jgi:hypothetical protein
MWTSQPDVLTGKERGNGVTASEHHTEDLEVKLQAFVSSVLVGTGQLHASAALPAEKEASGWPAHEIAGLLSPAARVIYALHFWVALRTFWERSRKILLSHLIHDSQSRACHHIAFDVADRLQLGFPSSRSLVDAVRTVLRCLRKGTFINKYVLKFRFIRKIVGKLVCAPCTIGQNECLMGRLYNTAPLNNTQDIFIKFSIIILLCIKKFTEIFNFCSHRLKTFILCENIKFQKNCS